MTRNDQSFYLSVPVLPITSTHEQGALVGCGGCGVVINLLDSAMTTFLLSCFCAALTPSVWLLLLSRGYVAFHLVTGSVATCNVAIVGIMDGGPLNCLLCCVVSY